MSCGDPRETDCSEVLDHLYEFLDHEMPDGDCAKFEVHIDACSPCLEKYGLEQAVKKLVKRCCGHDDVPADLRSKVMGRIELIRAGETVTEQALLETDPGRPLRRVSGPEAAGREPGPADSASAVGSAPAADSTPATGAAAAATSTQATAAQPLQAAPSSGSVERGGPEGATRD